MFRDGQVFHRSLKEGRALAQPQQTAAAAPLHHDPHITTGQAKDLFYIGDGTDMIEMCIRDRANGVLRTPVHRIAIRRSIPHRS